MNRFNFVLLLLLVTTVPEKSFAQSIPGQMQPQTVTGIGAYIATIPEYTVPAHTVPGSQVVAVPLDVPIATEESDPDITETLLYIDETTAVCSAGTNGGDATSAGNLASPPRY